MESATIAARKEHLLARSPQVVAARKALAERLLAFRERHDASRRVIAELVGCSQSNIRCIEELSSDPSFAVLHTLESLLKLSGPALKKLMADKGVVP